MQITQNKQEETISASVPEVSGSYDIEQRKLTINATNNLLSGTSSIFFIDNNTSYTKTNSDVTTCTSESVVQESAGALGSNVDSIFPDVFEPSKSWDESIQVLVENSETTTYEQFSIQLNEKTDAVPSGNSGYSLSSSDKNTSMPIIRGAIKENAFGKWADLNQLVWTFVFKSAGMDVQNISNDRDLLKSSDEFKRSAP